MNTTKTFHQFIENLKINLEYPLPGKWAHLKLMLPSRKKEFQKPHTLQAKKSAVLILFYPINNIPYLIFIKRAVDGGVHSSQIAFPGGQYEDKDKSLKTTALRESFEELQINSNEVEIIGKLSKLYIPPSNFDVYPFVGYTLQRPVFKPNQEVQRIIEVRFTDLVNPVNFQYKKIKHRNGKKVETPCFYVNKEIIWGATAMIVNELLTIINR